MKHAAISLLLGAVVAAAPTIGDAQKIPRVGYIGPVPNEPFLQAMRELDYVEGRNIVHEFQRWGSDPSGGDMAGMRAAAEELVMLPVDVLVTFSPATRAAQLVTKTTPIVMIVAVDPVAFGYVQSLARPEANITGVAMVSQVLLGKRGQLLKEAVPAAKRVAILQNPDLLATAGWVKTTEAAATSLGLETRTFDYRTPQDVVPAVAALKAWPADAAIAIDHPNAAPFIAALDAEAARQRIPLMCGAGGSGIALMECLLNYAVYDPNKLFLRAAIQADRILKGAKPGDIPVEEPTAFQLLVNLKAAKDIGVEIPQAFLLRADDVIE